MVHLTLSLKDVFQTYKNKPKFCNLITGGNPEFNLNSSEQARNLLQTHPNPKRVSTMFFLDFLTKVVMISKLLQKLSGFILSQYLSQGALRVIKHL